MKREAFVAFRFGANPGAVIGIDEAGHEHSEGAVFLDFEVDEGEREIKFVVQREQVEEMIRDLRIAAERVDRRDYPLCSDDPRHGGVREVEVDPLPKKGKPS